MIDLKYRGSSLLQYCWVIGFAYVLLYNSLPDTFPKWMYQFTLPVLRVLDVLYFCLSILLTVLDVCPIVALIFIFWWLMKLNIFSCYCPLIILFHWMPFQGFCPFLTFIFLFDLWKFFIQYEYKSPLSDVCYKYLHPLCGLSFYWLIHFNEQMIKGFYIHTV